MNSKHELSRITIDISKESHKKLKAIAAVLGRSMRDIVVESIETCIYNSKFPNKETLKAIKQIEKGKNLVRAKDAKDFFKKMSI